MHVVPSDDLVVVGPVPARECAAYVVRHPNTVRATALREALGGKGIECVAEPAEALGAVIVCAVFGLPRGVLSE